MVSNNLFPHQVLVLLVSTVAVTATAFRGDPWAQIPFHPKQLMERGCFPRLRQRWGRQRLQQQAPESCSVQRLRSRVARAQDLVQMLA